MANPAKNAENPRWPDVVRHVTRPQVILFFLTLLNFVWYFSHSSTVQHFGSKTITLCVVCAWYWDWAITNPPSLLLVAAICLLFRGWKGSLIALLISGYVVADGIKWLSNRSDLARGIASRIEAISQNEVLPLWQAPDWQYVLAGIFFAIALSYFIRNVQPTKHLS